MTKTEKRGSELIISRPQLDRYQADSYIKNEFLAIKTNPFANVFLKNEKEIKAKHRLIREAQFGVYRERKKKKFSAIRLVKKSAKEAVEKPTKESTEEPTEGN